MKDILCKAFCDGLAVRSVPAGLAVRTPFSRRDGDQIGFYVREVAEGYRIEDNGLVLPMLEAEGLDFRSGSRGEAMTFLLDEYAVIMDVEERQFTTAILTKDELAAGAMRFVAFCLRVGDFSLMTEARTISTFRDDVRRLLTESVSNKSEITESVPITANLTDFPADFVLRTPGRDPVGVYLATGDGRVLEAMVVQMRASYETHEPCSIIALMERGKSITGPVRRNAANRLAAVAEFRGDEVASIQRIVREAVGQTYH